MLQSYPRSNALYEVSIRWVRYLPPASFRFHLAMDTLALGYSLPAIRVAWGLAPVRQCSCRAYNKKQRPLFVAALKPVPHYHDEYNRTHLKNSLECINIYDFQFRKNNRSQDVKMFVLSYYIFCIRVDCTIYKFVILWI